MFLILKKFRISIHHKYILYWFIIIYYYIDILRYLSVYQNIDSDNENADIMSEKNTDSINDNDATKTQLREENIQKSDDNKKFETAAEYWAWKM